MAKSKVDKYGRVLIPKEIRRGAGLEEGEDIEILRKGSRIMIQKKSENVAKKVEELEDYLRRNLPEPFSTEPTERESKWMSKGHGLKKLGVRRESSTSE